MVLVSKSHAHIIAPNPQTHEIIIQKQVFFFFPGRGISVNVTKKSHHFHLPIFQLICADTRELPWNYFKKKKRKKEKIYSGPRFHWGPTRGPSLADPGPRLLLSHGRPPVPWLYVLTCRSPIGLSALQYT